MSIEQQLTLGASNTRQPAGQRAAFIDLDAIADNVATLAALAPGARLMAVLKADAYGHGLVPVARAVLRGGANYLGTAVLEEALALRAAGIQAPIFAWLSAPGANYAGAIAQDIDVAAYDVAQLREIAAAAREAGRPARIHLKIDTGMWRGGSTARLWPELCAAARREQDSGSIRIIGIWSHLACADEPGHRATDVQLENFRQALRVAEACGVVPELRHIANSAATLHRRDSHFDMVRTGLAIYGVNPLPDCARTDAMRLRPAMTLSARVVQVKRAPAGAEVSYGGAERTAVETSLAVIPLGYADGVMRSASSRGEVQIGAGRFRSIGRICMDQFVVDVQDAPVRAGDEAVLFGPGDAGEPGVEQWAQAAGTIPYEILTGIGARAQRIYYSVSSGT